MLEDNNKVNLQEEIISVALSTEEEIDTPLANIDTPELSKWKSAVRKSTARTVKPELPTTAGAPTEIKAKGTQMGVKKKENRPNYVENIQKNLPPTPATESEPELISDPNQPSYLQVL